MRRLTIAAALIGFGLLAVPGPALAACETTPSTEEGIRSARVVFVGRVTAVENNNRTATFDVEWVWKGEKVFEEVTVLGGPEDPTVVTGDDRQFQVGVTYLVVSPTTLPPYVADRCTATRPWQGVGSAIPANFQAAVGAEVGRSPEPIVVAAEESSILDGPVLPIVFGAIVLGGIAFAIGRILRGPERAVPSPTSKPKKPAKQSRLPSVGRSGEGLSGRFRRSGVSQAKKLRGIRHGRKARKASKRSGSGRSKRAKKGSLRTDRLASSGDDSPRETADV